MRTTATAMLALILSPACGGSESAARHHGEGNGGSAGAEMDGGAGPTSGGTQSGSAGAAVGGSSGGSGAGRESGGASGLSGSGGVDGGAGGAPAGGNGGGGAGGNSGGAGGRSCTTAVDVEFTGGSFTFTGDTSAGIDEFPGLTCDSTQVADSFAQPQIYFRFEAVALRTYRFRLTPSFYGFGYVFPLAAACDGAAVQQACSSAGETGMVSRIVNPGQTGESIFQPAIAGTYFFAVDSDTSAGSFEITVTET